METPDNMLAPLFENTTSDREALEYQRAHASRNITVNRYKNYSTNPPTKVIGLGKFWVWRPGILYKLGPIYGYTDSHYHGVCGNIHMYIFLRFPWITNRSGAIIAEDIHMTLLNRLIPANQAICMVMAAVSIKKLWSEVADFGTMFARDLFSSNEPPPDYIAQDDPLPTEMNTTKFVERGDGGYGHRVVRYVKRYMDKDCVEMEQEHRMNNNYEHAMTMEKSIALMIDAQIGITHHATRELHLSYSTHKTWTKHLIKFKSWGLYLNDELGENIPHSARALTSLPSDRAGTEADRIHPIYQWCADDRHYKQAKTSGSNSSQHPGYESDAGSTTAEGWKYKGWVDDETKSNASEYSTTGYVGWSGFSAFTSSLTTGSSSSTTKTGLNQADQHNDTVSHQGETWRITEGSYEDAII